MCQRCATVGDCEKCGDAFCGSYSCTGGFCDHCKTSYCSECQPITHFYFCNLACRAKCIDYHRKMSYCSECQPINHCYYCNLACCAKCIDYEKGDVLHCICHDKDLCSECLARREDRQSLCTDCVTRAEKYLDGCMWR